MKLVLVISVILKLFSCVTGAKILAIQVVPTKSYANIISSIVRNLAGEHEITFYSITLKKYSHPNVTLIHIPEPDYVYMEQENIFEKMLIQDDTSADAESSVMSLNDDYINSFLSAKDIQDLIHTKEKYDLMIIVTSLAEHLIQLGYHLKVPIVQVTASTPFPWQNDAIGSPNFLSYDYSLLNGEQPDTFLNRVTKYIKQIRALIRFYWFYLPSIEKVTKKYLPPGTPPIAAVMKNTSLLLVNTIEAMGYARPSLSNYVEIGGLHCEPPKALPKDLQEFMDGAKDGVIFFSLGSTFQAEIPEKTEKAFIKVFSNLKQRVIWKVNKDMEGLPTNIKAMRWCPQQDVLGHKNTKLFITQGGMLSLQETIFHGVPVLIIPIAFDQPINAKVAVNLGYGRYMPLSQFSVERMIFEINAILSNPTYKQKVEHISMLMKDTQLSPKEKLKWWINYVIRHKGVPIYRSQDDRYSWTKNIEIDILLFLVFSVIFLVVISVYLVRILFKQMNYYTFYVKNKSKIN